MEGRAHADAVWGEGAGAAGWDGEGGEAAGASVSDAIMPESRSAQVFSGPP
jgi:hypothetical protein